MESDGPAARVSSSKSSLATSPISPLSLVSSSTSEGVVLDQEEQDINSGIDFDSSDCCTDNESDCGDVSGVDGLVLMGSTRLRPAPETSSVSPETRVQLYTQTFRNLFGRADCTQTLLPLALHGNLQNNFRSLCWRVFLNVLPSNSQQWASSVHTLRENYKFLVDKFHTAQRLQDSSIDLNINNPLSQAEDSPWNQHFQDTELRRLVEQDVNRVFPDLEFFQSKEIREILSNILFHFSRCHPDIGYRQGMHELAAPLLYVIRTDCETFSGLRASLGQGSGDPGRSKALAELVATVPPGLLDLAMVEADTFSLFEALMEGQLADWYRTSSSRHNSPGEQEPWGRPQDRTSGNPLVSSLNNIQDVLLKRHDPALYTRLEKLEIFPQIYGIRWLRLLFGREFPFRETLMLWDAIFADSCPPSLCDQLVVSLLMALRDLLLRYEYQDAVQLLMKLPSNLSVHYCTLFALHLKDPLRFPKPTGSAFTAGSGHRDPYVRSKKMVKMSSAKRSESPTQLLQSKARQFSEKHKAKFQVNNKAESMKHVTEMEKSHNIYRAYSLHDDKNSDFTVLDLHKENDEDSSVRVSGNSMHYSRSNSSQSSQRDPRILREAVSNLDSLLRREKNLSNRAEIFQCLGVLQTISGSQPSDQMNANGVNRRDRRNKEVRKERDRTTSLAVDVASYFKVEMDD